MVMYIATLRQRLFCGTFPVNARQSRMILPGACALPSFRYWELSGYPPKSSASPLYTPAGTSGPMSVGANKLTVNDYAEDNLALSYLYTNR
jgi:hypothetical protein